MHAYVLDGAGCTLTSEVAAIQEAAANDRRLWLQVEREDLRTRDLLSTSFALHPLLIDDVWQHSPLPKVADFDAYLHIVLHSIDPGSTPEDVKFIEVDLFVGMNFLISRLQHHPHGTDDARVRKLLEKGPAWLAHSVIDRLVDRYVPLLDQVDQRINELESEIVAKAGTPAGGSLVKRIFALKRSLAMLRRTSVHQREVLLQLSRGEFDEIPQEALPFFRDAYDHFLRVTDLAESHRESLVSLLDVFWSVQSNRMNEVMKRLTLMSTIMLPLTFIAGVYGMNFDGMPELHWRYGYPAALALMLVVALVIFGWFRRKRWI